MCARLVLVFCTVDSCARVQRPGLNFASGEQGRGNGDGDWGRGKGRGDFSKFAYIDRVAHTSGRRVAEWGNLRSLQLFLVLSLRYALGASPSELNLVSNKVYTAIR